MSDEGEPRPAGASAPEGPIPTGDASPTPAPAQASAASAAGPLWWWVERLWALVFAVAAGLCLRPENARLVPLDAALMLGTLMCVAASLTTIKACWTDLKTDPRRSDATACRAQLSFSLAYTGVSTLALTSMAVPWIATALGVSPKILYHKLDDWTWCIMFAGLWAWCVGAAFTIGSLAIDRRKTRALGAVALALVPLLVAVSLDRSRTRDEARRRCYANQKTIVGALEMYNLDHNTRRTDLDGMWTLLVSGNYLQAAPLDSGEESRTSTHYKTTSNGNGITCVVHGPIE